MEKKFRILITGASGFLGAAMVQHFCETGHIVLGLSRESSSLWRVPLHLRENVVSARIEEWGQKFVEFRPEIVICASWSGVGVDARENLEIQHENIIQHAELAELSKKMGVLRFIAFGSQAESEASPDDIEEIAITSGLSAYGKTKQAVLKEITKIFQDERSYSWVRVFSVYGPKDHEKTLISKLLSSLSSESEVVAIKNEDLLWSFLYIDDFCAAIQMVITNRNLTGVINLGNPELNTIGQVRDMILELPPGTYIPRRNAFYPGLGKLHEASWHPGVDLELGLARTRNWYQANNGTKIITEKAGE